MKFTDYSKSHIVSNHITHSNPKLTRRSNQQTSVFLAGGKWEIRGNPLIHVKNIQKSTVTSFVLRIDEICVNLCVILKSNQLTHVMKVNVAAWENPSQGKTWTFSAMCCSENDTLSAYLSYLHRFLLQVKSEHVKNIWIWITRWVRYSI